MAQIEVYFTTPKEFDFGNKRARIVDQEAHHLARVRRSRPGDLVMVINGIGSAWSARVLSIDSQEVIVELLERFDNWREPKVEVQLGLGILKSDGFEAAVNLAVQAGVNAITPLKTRYVVAKWADYRCARCERIALTASKQCGRGLVPSLKDAQPYEEWCIQQSSADHKLILDPDGEAFPVIEEDQVVALAVGPEGGFADEEIEFFVEKGFRKVRLGARRLRAETAAALAVAQVTLPLE